MRLGPVIGGILLVAGTTIGVGMLGLPVMTSFMGFFPSLILLTFCWAFMLVSGFLFIEINDQIGSDANLVSMAEKTLGPIGKALAWIFYLLLLYSLMAAYMSGSAPLFQTLFPGISQDVSKFVLPLVFGSFIYLGTKGVDWINRVLMIGLIGAYILLIAFIPPHLNPELLTKINLTPFFFAAPVVLTSFGYHIIIPSLATYLHHDKKTLYKVIIIGSLLAFVINALWQFLILGSIPFDGNYGLKEAFRKGLPATAPLGKLIESKVVQRAGYAFSIFAIITSFLGVGLSLSDFLKDGLHLKNSLKGRLLAIFLTFIPPLLFIFSYERGFLIALEYAGAFVAILLVLMPALMMWKLENPRIFATLRGKILLSSLIIFSGLIIFVNLLIQAGVFDKCLN
jgi:tyrosine-specific transport protein